MISCRNSYPRPGEYPCNLFRTRGGDGEGRGGKGKRERRTPEADTDNHVHVVIGDWPEESEWSDPCQSDEERGEERPKNWPGEEGGREWQGMMLREEWRLVKKDRIAIGGKVSFVRGFRRAIPQRRLPLDSANVYTTTTTTTTREEA